MKVVALDIATNTGVCVGEAGATPKAWTVNLGEKCSEDARFSRVLHLTHTLIAEHLPDLVVVEAAIGGKNASAFLIGLVACVRGVSFNRGVRCETAHLASIRRHFVGKNLTVKDFPGLTQTSAKRAIKLEVVKRCALLGWSPNTDDEADAMACWDYACATWARGYQSKPQGGLFNATETQDG